MRYTPRYLEIIVLPQFLDVRRPRSDERVASAGENLRFTTVLSVRRARSDESIVSRRDLWNLPCVQNEKQILKKGSTFEEQPFSQQHFSAALLSSLSPQLFSAAFRLSSSQQHFSAAFLSSSSQQPFSAAFLSSLCEQLFSGSHPELSSCSGQGLVVSYWHHLAVVRGWWSSCCGQGLVVSYLASSCCGQWLAVNYDNFLWKNPFATLSVKTEIISTSPTKTSIWKPSSVNSFAFPITLWTHPLSPGAAVVFPPWSLYPKTPSCRAFGR